MYPSTKSGNTCSHLPICCRHTMVLRFHPQLEPSRGGSINHATPITPNVHWPTIGVPSSNCHCPKQLPHHQLLQQSTTGTNSSAKNQLNMVGSEIGCMCVQKFDIHALVYTSSKFGVPHSSYFYPSLSRCCHKSLLISFSIRCMPWCLCVSVNGLRELKKLAHRGTVTACHPLPPPGPHTLPPAEGGAVGSCLPVDGHATCRQHVL